MLLCAFAFFLAHSMIPHHHERIDKDVAHHHHHGDADHSHGEDNDNDENFPLGSSSHDATFGQVLIKTSPIKADFITEVSDAFISNVAIQLTVVYESPPDIPIPKNIRLYNLTCFSYAVPLRAPPYCLFSTC